MYIRSIWFSMAKKINVLIHFGSSVISDSIMVGIWDPAVDPATIMEIGSVIPVGPTKKEIKGSMIP